MCLSQPHVASYPQDLLAQMARAMVTREKRGGGEQKG